MDEFEKVPLLAQSSPQTGGSGRTGCHSLVSPWGALCVYDPHIPTWQHLLVVFLILLIVHHSSLLCG